MEVAIVLGIASEQGVSFADIKPRVERFRFTLRLPSYCDIAGNVLVWP